MKPFRNPFTTPITFATSLTVLLAAWPAQAAEGSGLGRASSHESGTAVAAGAGSRDTTTASTGSWQISDKGAAATNRILAGASPAAPVTASASGAVNPSIVVGEPSKLAGAGVVASKTVGSPVSGNATLASAPPLAAAPAPANKPGGTGESAPDATPESASGSIFDWDVPPAGTDVSAAPRMSAADGLFFKILGLDFTKGFWARDRSWTVDFGAITGSVGLFDNDGGLLATRKAAPY